MKVVITYGTFDLFHEGHYNILKRAKELGDYLIVGVTSENYDKNRGKLNVEQSVTERIENVKKTGFADKIIIEEYEGQKIDDIKKFHVDIFVIGSDWINKFDYLNEYTKVVYLERTKGVSSTQLRNRNRGIVKLGCVGAGRIAKRMCVECKYVSGINLDYVYSKDIVKTEKFAKENELKFYTDNYDELLKRVDAVYIATPHLTHYEYAKKALLAGKNVLCEKPITLDSDQARELYKIANEQNVILYEAIKTVYSPAFKRLVAIAKSGKIGDIKEVSATFTKLLINKNLREFDCKQAGGSVNELITYPLIAIFKLMGIKYKSVDFYSYFDKEKNIDLYTKAIVKYEKGIATAQVGIGVKSEGNLIISGTKGYIYVPAPWWKTECFEVRFEDSKENEKFFYKFNGDGLRYEVAEFLTSIISKNDNLSLTNDESIAIAQTLENFNKRNNVFNI